MTVEIIGAKLAKLRFPAVSSATIQDQWRMFLPS